MEPLEIKTQGQNRSDFCTGCAIASIAEPFIGEPCDEAFSFAMGRRVSGEPPQTRGLFARHALQGAKQFGVLPKSKSPFTGAEPRDVLADWHTWEPYMSFAAKPFASYRRVYNPRSHTNLYAGLFWQAEWDKSPLIESMETYNRFMPHEVRILGWKDGYYVIQNSRGAQIGDCGLWYYRDTLPFRYVYRFTQSAHPLDTLLELL